MPWPVLASIDRDKETAVLVGETPAPGGRTNSKGEGGGLSQLMFRHWSRELTEEYNT